MKIIRYRFAVWPIWICMILGSGLPPAAAIDPVSKTVIEDAEDGRVDGWWVYDGGKESAAIRNVIDPERGGRAVRLEGEGLTHGFYLPVPAGAVSSGTEGPAAEWRMKTAGDFRVYFQLKTTAGKRFLCYSPVNRDGLGSGTHVNYGLGTHARDGQWRAFERNLGRDLREAQPGVSILEVKAFLFRGNGMVDDIALGTVSKSSLPAGDSQINRPAAAAVAKPVLKHAPAAARTDRSRAPRYTVLYPQSAVRCGETVYLSVRRDFADDTGFECSWSAERGVIGESGARTAYRAPDAPGADAVTVSIRDGGGRSYVQTLHFDAYRQYIILKADDLMWRRDKMPRWNRYRDFVLSRGIKTSIGIVGASLEPDRPAYFGWVRELDATPNFEFWDHGYNHIYSHKIPGGGRYSEFRSTPLEYQRTHQLKTRSLAFRKLGIHMRSFGAPGNAIDENTSFAVSGIDNLWVWLKPNFASSKFMMSSIAQLERWSQGVKPDFDLYEQDYNPHADYLLYEAHPPHWPDETFPVFERIIADMQDRGLTFALPSEYVELTESPNPATVYEDGETGDTLAWSLMDGGSAGNPIRNVYDDDRKSRVIELDPDGNAEAFALANPGGSDWRNPHQFAVRWSAKTEGDCDFAVRVVTDAGAKTLVYRMGPDEQSAEGCRAVFGLGRGAAPGAWLDFARDLAADAARVWPGAKLLEVNGAEIRGAGRFDDIQLLDRMPEDIDGDGIVNDREAPVYGTSPNNADTDGDGLSEGDEAAFWGEFIEDDFDGDGKTPLLDPDSDEDGEPDGAEYASGGDPGLPIVFEDAEDGAVWRWTVSDNDPAGALVSNHLNAARGNHVIHLSGDGLDNAYRLLSRKKDDWNHAGKFILDWSMNFTEPVEIRVALDTSAGPKTLVYAPDASGPIGAGEEIRIGLGSAAMDGTWRSYGRDLREDLAAPMPDCQILAVRHFTVRGSGMVDDIRLR